MNGFVLSTMGELCSSDLRSCLTGVELFEDFALFGDRKGFLHVVKFNDDNAEYEVIKSLKIHLNSISSIIYMKPCDWFPKGAIITSSFDQMIYAWNVADVFVKGADQIEPIETLFGHSNEICFLTNGENIIISTGWDSRAIIHRENAEPTILEHNSFAIWSVEIVGNKYITAGADKTLRIWTDEGKLIKTIENAHSLPIRSIKYVHKSNILVSVANDGHLREWVLENDDLRMLRDTTISDSYLYFVEFLCDEIYLTGGESSFFSIFSSKEGKVVDFLPYKGSLWNACVSRNGDIIGVAENGSFIKFTKDQRRKANSELENEYMKHVSSNVFRQAELIEADINCLQKRDEIESAQGKVGHLYLVNDDHQKVVLIWSLGYQRYLVFGSVPSPRKVFDKHGNEWDFMITIYIGDEEKQYHLFGNSDINEFVLARDFVIANDLPIRFIDQIANFVMKNKPANSIETEHKVLPKNEFSFVTTSFSISQTVSQLSFLTNDEKSIIENNQLSQQLIDLLCKIIKEKSVNQCYAALEMLRYHILNDEISLYLRPDEIHQILENIFGQNSINDKAMQSICRLISNLTKHFSQIVLKSQIINFIHKMGIRYPVFPSQVQCSFSNMVYNITIVFQGSNQMEELIEPIKFMVTKSSTDDALKHMLYASGNAIVYSKKAPLKFVEVINELQVLKVTGDLKSIINEIAKLVK